MGPIFRVFLTSFLFFLSTNSQSEYRVPDPPENVRIKTTSTTATLWWDPPFSASNILVRGYTISYGIDTPGNKIVIEGVQTNVFTVEGLKPNTKYVFAVTAYNEAEEEDSEKIFLTAKTESNQNIVENHFRLQSPNDVKIVPLSPNDVEIIWSDPVSETPSENTVDYATKRRFYIVQYSLMGSENSGKKLTTEKNRILLTNLDENKDYEIAIRTVLPDGRESPWSSRKYFRTPSSSTRELAFFMDKEKTENEEICDFETADICDYFSDPAAPIQFYRQTSIEGFKDRNGGHFLTIEASKQPNDKFGRLLSPVWSFHKDSFCLMLWTLIRADSTGTLTISILYEGDSMNMAVPIYKSKLEKMQKETWIELVVESKIRRKRSFQLIIEVRKQILKGKFLVSVDDIKAKSGTCLDRKNPFQKSIAGLFDFLNMIKSTKSEV